MLPVKIETYLMDIRKTDPVFVLDHELTELYDMPDLSPHSFDDLSLRLRQDADLALVFERAKTAFGPNPLDECDKQCRRYLHCNTWYSVHSDVRACLGLREEGSFFDDPYLKMATLTAGTWRQDRSFKQ